MYANLTGDKVKLAGIFEKKVRDALLSMGSNF
jgi:hypothetical protein